MAATVARMTKEELRELLAELIEEKFLELLGDPDQGLPLRESVRKRLVRQQKAVRQGQRGQPMADVARRLDLG